MKTEAIIPPWCQATPRPNAPTNLFLLPPPTKCSPTELPDTRGSGTSILMNVHPSPKSTMFPWLATWEERTPTWASPPKKAQRMAWNENRSFAEALEAFLASAPENTGLFWPGPAIGLVPSPHYAFVAAIIISFSQGLKRFALVETRDQLFLEWLDMRSRVIANDNTPTIFSSWQEKEGSWKLVSQPGDAPDEMEESSMAVYEERRRIVKEGTRAQHIAQRNFDASLKEFFGRDERIKNKKG